MGKLIPICLAEFMVIKGMALIGLALVGYLWWLGFKEKRDRRREQAWLESRRSELRKQAEARNASSVPLPPAVPQAEPPGR
jgi:hypothetical protein